jgi:hypothetical protein
MFRMNGMPRAHGCAGVTMLRINNMVWVGAWMYRKADVQE